MAPAGPLPGALPPTIGRYQILARLAADLSDDVFKAFDPLIERPIVVKIFSLADASATSVAAIRQTFYGEMQRTGMLGHPGITTLFDAGELPGALFMATEFVDGASLAELLAEGLTPEVPIRVSIVAQVADALEYAREQGVLHLNLRPSAVLVGTDFALKIRGFGVARVLEALTALAGRSPMPVSPYTAPERAAGQPGDARSDVFSLASLALNVLDEPSGRDGAAPSDLPSHLTAHGVQSDRWAGVFARALASDPAARFATAGEFKRALLLALGMDELDVRLAWEASREVGTLVAHDRTTLGLPRTTSVHDKRAATLAETRLHTGVEEPDPQTDRRSD